MPKLKVIPSRLYRLFSPALVGAVAFAFATTALADPVWDQVGEAFGKAGTEMPGGVYRIALPRADIKATLDGVELKPGFALGGWLTPSRRWARPRWSWGISCSPKTRSIL